MRFAVADRGFPSRGAASARCSPVAPTKRSAAEKCAWRRSARTSLRRGSVAAMELAMDTHTSVGALAAACEQTYVYGAFTVDALGGVQAPL